MAEKNAFNLGKKNSRVTSVDVAKGLCMFVVIMSHTVHAEGEKSFPLISRGMAMSFHMPLFFILSAYTFHFSENMEQFKKAAIKSAKRLLIPSLIIFVIRIFMYDKILTEGGVSLEYFIKKSLSLLFSSGVGINFAGLDVPAFGMIWFLMVLFVARVLFDYIHLVFEEKYVFPLCALFSIVGVTLGKSTTTFLAIDIAFAILPLFCFGYKLRNVNFENKKPLIIIRDALIAGAVWGGLLYVTFPDYRHVSYLELAPRNYPIYPLCFIIAIAGTVMFCKICCLIDKIPGLAIILRFIGKNSLYLYMIHCLDMIWDKLWVDYSSQKIQVLMRCLTDFGAFLILIVILYAPKLLIGKKVKEVN